MNKVIKALTILSLMTIGTTAWGGIVEGTEAEKIIVKGEIIHSDSISMNVIYKERFYVCYMDGILRIELQFKPRKKLELHCTNTD